MSNHVQCRLVCGTAVINEFIPEYLALIGNIVQFSGSKVQWKVVAVSDIVMLSKYFNTRFEM